MKAFPLRPRRLAVILAGAACLWTSPALAETRWRIEPSPVFDALCLTTIVGNDPYTTQFYQAQRQDIVARLSPEASAAATRVSEAFKAAGIPLIGWLGLVYSASGATNLDELIAATENSAPSRARLEPTEYWYPDRWDLYEGIRADLLLYLRGLKAAGYEQWWSAGARPEVEGVLADLRPRLAPLDISPILTRVLRRPVDREIVVEATRFCRPFGSRLLGSRFIMDVVGKRDPFRSVAAGALHEMTHPPFDLTDPRAVALIAQLERDPTLHGRWEGRPTDSGYNTFEGYINEDVTRALDQIIGARVGVTFMDDARQRWREQENGFHMAAAVFHHLMETERFLDGDESVLEFLDRMRREGRLSPAATQRIVADTAGGR